MTLGYLKWNNPVRLTLLNYSFCSGLFRRRTHDYVHILAQSGAEHVQDTRFIGHRKHSKIVCADG